jgi:hypothetical protein
VSLLRAALLTEGTQTVFARKVQVEIVQPEPARPCPLAWLDNFCMRSFTGRSAFDDTLPIADGRLEVGTRVDLEALRVDLEDWLTRKFGEGKPVRLRLSELPRE